MRIHDLRVSVVETPLDVPLRTNWGAGLPQESIRHLLVRVRSDEGIEGVAAGPCSSVGAARYLADVAAPLLVGHDIVDRIGIWTKVSAIAQEYAWPWVLEVACWDAFGKSCGLPLYALLGGGVRRLPAYASFAERKRLDETLDAVARARDVGFSAVKLRASLDEWPEDLEVVNAVTAKYPDLDVMVDANEGSVNVGAISPPRRRVKDVIACAETLAEAGVRWFEEPFPRHDLDALATIRVESPVPIAGGELNVGLEQFRQLIQRGCYDIYQPDCMFSGGVYGSHAIARATEVFGVDFTPHTWSNGLGLAANFHCAVASSAWVVEYPFDPPGLSPTSRDRILAEPLRVRSDGILELPDRPGLGVELDEEAVRHFTVASFAPDPD